MENHEKKEEHSSIISDKKSSSNHHHHRVKVRKRKRKNRNLKRKIIFAVILSVGMVTACGITLLILEALNSANFPI